MRVPRPLINQRTTVGSTYPAGNRHTTTPNARMLQGRRSTRYVETLGRLDASANLSPLEVQDIIEQIRREFAEKWTSTPIGIVSRCHLGDPFEVHTLGFDGSIIEHYRVGEVLPGGLDRARDLARSDVYLAIEVYPDRLACVRADGSTVLLGSDT